MLFFFWLSKIYIVYIITLAVYFKYTSTNIIIPLIKYEYYNQNGDLYDYMYYGSELSVGLLKNESPKNLSYSIRSDALIEENENYVMYYED